MTETMTGKTVDEMLFRNTFDVACTRMERIPAGTTVYVTERCGGAYIARIPGTLLERVILLINIEPA